jgi:hypothetical protein
MFDSMFATMSFTSSKERRRIEDMFDSYMSDLPQNLYENQFSLQAKYEGTSYQDWVRILTHPAFDTWKQQQIAIIATTSTDRALAGVDTNKDTLSLLKMRQDVLNAEKTAEKPTIIVLPEELFFKGD